MSSVEAELQQHESKSGSASELEHNAVAEKVGTRPARSRLMPWLAAGGAALVLLALALGLGLGLGLRKHRHSDAQVQSAQTASSVTVDWNGKPLPVIPRSKLVDPSQFILNPSWDVNAAPTTRQYNWTISRVLSNPAGPQRPMLAVNQMSPGPTVEANVGDQILVYVTNDLGNATTSIHWHGALQNGTNFMDGTSGVTECGIAPGETRVYNWTAQIHMTSWWHAHSMGQYSDGLVGALIVHSPDEVYKLRSSAGQNQNGTSLQTAASNATFYDADVIILAGDFYNSMSPQWLATYFQPGQADGTFEGAEPVPDAGLVAGYGEATCLGLPAGTPCDGGQYANFTFEPNKRYRLRFINTGSIADIQFSVDGHPLTLIEADSTELQPQQVTSVTAMVAQRYSVLIDTNQPAGAFFIRGYITSDMLAYNNPALNQDQKAVMRYSTAPADAMPNATAPALQGNFSDFDPTKLKPAVALNPPAATALTELLVSFGTAQSGDYRAFVNGTSWEAQGGGTSTLLEAFSAAQTNTSFTAPDSQFVISVNDYAVIDIVISNDDEAGHPIHMHGYIPYVLGQGAGNFAPSKLDRSQTFENPIRRDVFTLPAYGWVAVRIVVDNPGVWLMHCHIVAHMEAGFAMSWNLLPSKIDQWQYAQVSQGCPAVAAFAKSHPSSMG